jgi:oxygen-independent coproporphyrinogen-3 oxidase
LACRISTLHRAKGGAPVQPAEQVFALMPKRASCGFESINVDLIYGLPKQTPSPSTARWRRWPSCGRTASRCTPTPTCPSASSPSGASSRSTCPPVRLQQGVDAGAFASAFHGAGYVYIGMDHFALPNDALAVAKRQGRLHRNFQGYSTQPDCDLIGLGVSAIGRVGATYSQNAKTLEEYTTLLDQGHFCRWCAAWR